MENYSKKSIGSIAIALLFILITGTGCTAIAGIFKAGMWTGIIIVVAVIALIIFLISRGSRNS